MLDVLRSKFERLDKERETKPSSLKRFPRPAGEPNQAVEVWSSGHLTDIPISELALFEDTYKVNSLIAQPLQEAKRQQNLLKLEAASDQLV